MRHCKITKFPSARKYNSLYNLLGTNCLAFAFGRTTDPPESYDLLTIDQINSLKNGKSIPKVDICDMFVKKAKTFGLSIRQISNLSEADGKVLFILFGWYTDYIKNIGNYDYFFHVVRRDEYGVYEHKADWYEKAKVMSDKELLNWLYLNIERYYFVLD